MTQQEAQEQYDSICKQRDQELETAKNLYYAKNKQQSKNDKQLKDFGYDYKAWNKKIDNFKKDIAKSGLKINSNDIVIFDYDKDDYIRSTEKNFDAFVKEFYKSSENTNCTPQRGDACDSGVDKIKDYIAESSIFNNMSESDKNYITTKLIVYAQAKMAAAWSTSLRRHPREVNGKMPFIGLNSEQMNELKQLSDKINETIDKNCDAKLNEWDQNKSFPGEQKAGDWFDEEVKRVVASNAKDATEAEADFLKQKAMGRKSVFLNNYKKRTGETDDDETRVKNQAGNQGNGPKIHRSTMQISDWAKTNVSFSGCDMVVSAEMKTTRGARVSVTMGSTQTISYSIYRKLSPILGIGNVNAKDYVGGPRTIAGSIVFTVFNEHWGTELLDAWQRAEGISASQKVLMDEIAPLDITISMANEYGVCSRLALYSVRLFSEGQVMSINDIYTENTYQYVALNIDYLADINSTIDTSNAASISQPTIKKNISPVNDGGKTTTQNFNAKTQDRIPDPAYQTLIDLSKYNNRAAATNGLQQLKDQTEKEYLNLYREGKMDASTYQKLLIKSNESYSTTVDRINANFNQ